MSPRLSYGSTATVISTDIEKRNQNLMPISFYWNWIEKSVQLIASSWRQNFQIFIVVYLHINSNISTDVKYLWLLLSLCSLSYYSSSACQEVLQSRVWAISSSFTLVINLLNLLKHQFDQSLSTTQLVILLRIQPVRLDWSPSLLSSFAVLRVVMSPR
jgi:hypothetical protein